METQTKDQFNFILKTQETPEIASKLNGCSKWDFSKFLNNFYPTNNSDEEKLSSENKDENKDPEDSNISNYDFSTLLKKIPDDYSDDEYSCLKKEIDSFIQADDTNLFQNYSNQNLLKPKCKFFFIKINKFYLSSKLIKCGRNSILFGFSSFISLNHHKILLLI